MSGFCSGEKSYCNLRTLCTFVYILLRTIILTNKFDRNKSWSNSESLSYNLPSVYARESQDGNPIGKVLVYKIHKTELFRRGLSWFIANIYVFVQHFEKYLFVSYINWQNEWNCSSPLICTPLCTIHWWVMYCHSVSMYCILHESQNANTADN